MILEACQEGAPACPTQIPGGVRPERALWIWTLAACRIPPSPQRHTDIPRSRRQRRGECRVLADCKGGLSLCSAPSSGREGLLKKTCSPAQKRIVWQETLNIVQRGLCLTPCAEGGYIRWRRPPPEAQLARAQGVFWPVNCGPSMGASVPNDCKSLGRHKAHTSEGTGSSCKTSAK